MADTEPPVNLGKSPADATVVAAPPEPVSAEDLRKVPRELWEEIKADPQRAPERVALAAARVHGPRAARWVEEQRRLGHADPHVLAQMVKKQHANYARYEGAATGVGGVFTMLPDLAALAWIQSRMVFFIAAAYGWDPNDPMRPAEMLVIQELYPDPHAARAALDGVGTSVAEAYVKGKLKRGESVTSRLAKMVGKRVAKRGARRVIPVAGIIFNAVGNERETRDLANRSILFYGGTPPAP